MKVEDYLQKSTDSVEEIYESPEDSYRILIMKYKTSRRDDAGIILELKSKLLSKDQVKLELARQNDSVVLVYTHLRNHTMMYDEVS